MNKQEQLHSKLNSNMSVSEIQNYIKQINAIRGFKNTLPEQMLLLIEEVGELAKAIRKDKTNVGIDETKLENYDTVEHEIADVFYVLTSIANSLNIDLFSALYAKEKINVNRKWNIK